MGRLRTIRVYVVGEVCQPSSFTLSSLSTLTNALFSAGGPLKLGSLRRIELKRNHHTIGTIDLYDFLLRGDKTRDFRLQSGDTIFVPPLGPVAAITGEVKRPAIYELQDQIHVSDLIEMAGGLTPRSYLKRVQVIRAKRNAEREVIDLDLTGIRSNGDAPRDIELMDGDFVRIYPADPRIYNTVRLEGAVKHPGEYGLKPGMRLSDLLRKEDLLPEAYTDKIEIARVKGNFRTEILSVGLQNLWDGDSTQDIKLQRLDLISVRSDFKTLGRVKLEGEAVRPGIYRFKRGERLSSVIRRAGGFTNKAFLKGTVFTRRIVREFQEKVVEDFVRSQEGRLLAESSQLTATSVGLSQDQVVAQQAVLVFRREQLKLLAAKITLGRIVVRLDEPEELEGTPNDLVLQDGDTLKIPQTPSTVMVLGSVRNPTAVLYKEDMDIQYYLNRSGGLTQAAASEEEIYLLKADGSAITGFVKLRDIDPGDVVVVPPSTEVPTQWVPLLKSIATIAGQLAIGVAGLVTIF
jgi:protein involved in polysaccharide export with SLBB domain